MYNALSVGRGELRWAVVPRFPARCVESHVMARDAWKLPLNGPVSYLVVPPSCARPGGPQERLHMMESRVERNDHGPGRQAVVLFPSGVGKELFGQRRVQAPLFSMCGEAGNRGISCHVASTLDVRCGHLYERRAHIVK